MIRKSVGLILVLGFLAIGSAQTGEDQARFEAVKQYWEWSSYFGVDGLDFPLLKYQPGKSFQALIFFDEIPREGVGSMTWYSKAHWGFCSSEIGICQAYGAFGDGTVDQGSGTKMKKGETEEASYRRFRQSDFSSDEDGPPITTLVPPQESQTPPTAGVPVIDLSRAAPQIDHYKIHTRRGSITLPRLDLPIAVRRKMSNAKAERAVREALYTPNGGCVVTVPYADERAFAIPMLVECRGKTEVTYAQKGPGGDWYFSHGGLVQDKSIINRLAPRIRSAASLVLREGPGR
jgi:hypothetical protein